MLNYQRVIPLGEIWKLQKHFGSRRRAVHRPARSRWAKPAARPWRCLGPEKAAEKRGKNWENGGKMVGKWWENGGKMVTISLWSWENGFRVQWSWTSEGPRLHFVEKLWCVAALEKFGFLKNVGNRCEIKRNMTKQEECWKLNDNDEKMLNTSENWWTKWRNYQEYPDFWCENDEKNMKTGRKWWNNLWTILNVVRWPPFL